MLVIDNGKLRQMTLKEEIDCAVKDCANLKLEIRMIKCLRS